MSFLAYVFVLLVAASSVLFGLDWMQAPLQPTARTQAQTFTAAPAQPAPGPTVAAAQAKPAPVTSGAPAASAAALTTAPAEATTGSTPVDLTIPEASETKPAPLCDVSACERAYRTFTADDCTYKPSEGPRRLCMRGNPPRRPTAQSTAKEANAQARCNIQACESAYQSFDAATCTYQPSWGARRLCTK